MNHDERSHWTKELIAEVGKPLSDAIFWGESETIRDIVAKHPWLVTDNRFSGVDHRGLTWVGYAATQERIEVVRLLIDLGFDIDAVEDEETALWQAIRKENVGIVELLLERGANPNIGRLLILAMTCDEAEERWTFIKLLVERGIDVNLVFEIRGDPDDLQTALDWCPFEDIAVYLREHGAKSAKELALAPADSPRKNDAPSHKSP